MHGRVSIFKATGRYHLLRLVCDTAALRSLRRHHSPCQNAHRSLLSANMKTTLMCALVLIFTLGFISDVPAKEAKLQHVVSFKFKSGAAPEQVKKVEDAFRALKGKIKEIHALEWGTNNSPEKLNKGFTHCFIVTFNSEKDRDAYLPHPDHKAFVEVLKPVLEDAFVIDFWAKE
jgi:hypothetical protein